MKNILVDIESDHIEGYIYSIRNKALTKRLITHLAQFGIESDGSTWTTLWEAPNWVPAHARRELDAGYPVSIWVDAWEGLHLWGYDAHRLAE